jgi:hypothetical protein
VAADLNIRCFYGHYYRDILRPPVDHQCVLARRLPLAAIPGGPDHRSGVAAGSVLGRGLVTQEVSDLADGSGLVEPD